MQIFGEQPVEEWIVTPQNLKEIIKTLNAQNLSEMKVMAYDYLSKQDSGEAPVTEFLRYMQGMIMNLPQRDLAQNF